MYLLQILLNSLVLGMQVVLIALPLYIIYAVSRAFNLSVAAFATAVGYIFYVVYTRTSSLLLAAMVSVAGALAFSYILYRMVEPFIKKGQELLVLLVTFSLAVLVEVIIGLVFGNAGRPILEEVLPTLSVGPLYLSYPGVLTLLAGVVFLVLLFLVLQRTPFGRMLRALSQDFTLAESLGVASARLRFWAYAVAIGLAGFVGVATGLHTALQPYMGMELLIMGLIAFLAGGFGHIWGTIVASFVVVLIPQLIIAYTPLSSSWEMVIMFLTAGVFLVFFPRGLASRSYRNC